MPKKGVHKKVIDWLKRIYKNNVTIVCVNNIQGKPILNIRLSLCQGDVPSMLFFCFAIDLLLHSLNALLTGFNRFSIPISGPLNKNETLPPHLNETLKLISYAVDLKPVVRSMAEISFCISECNKLELKSGVQLHRDPRSGK